MYKAIIGAIAGFFVWIFIVSVQTDESRLYIRLFFSNSADPTHFMKVLLFIFVVLGFILGVCWWAITGKKNIRDHSRGNYIDALFDLMMNFYKLCRDNLSKLPLPAMDGVKFLAINFTVIAIISYFVESLDNVPIYYRDPDLETYVEILGDPCIPSYKELSECVSAGANDYYKDETLCLSAYADPTSVCLSNDLVFMLKRKIGIYD